MAPVAPVQGAAIITNGLVLNLDAGNPASYSGTGTTWTDLSGNGNNGTLVNGVAYNATNQGSLIFNGNGNGGGSPNPYVSLPTSTAFNFGAGDFTVEMWTYITTLNPHPNLLTINGNSNWFAAIRLGYWQGNLGIIQSYNGNAWDANYSVPINVDVWSHIVLSRISGNVKVYINNVEKASYSLPGTLMSNAESQIGQLNHPNTGYFNLSGKIAITNIYKGKGLTSAEVSINFNAVKSRFSL
ncbi:MAG: hypothetical protein RL363_1423 [Bacteroidota bacterium]|jgi:hypothetical protein